MKKTFFIALIARGSVLVFMGALFKIQHWPYGQALLVVGMFLEVVAIMAYAGIGIKGSS